MSSLHISVAPEPIFHIGSVAVTNSLITSVLVMLFLIVLALLTRVSGTPEKPGKLRSLMEFIIEGFYNFFADIAGSRIHVLFPLLLTFFLYIIISNWAGLLPIVGPIGIWEGAHGEEKLIPLLRGPNADLNTTLALALISVTVTQVMSVNALGIKTYISRFINIKNPIDFVVGLLETISEFSKILSFSFRLFGNIFAGEVLLAVMTFLVPVLIPVPFLALEVFVGFIQALVFTMLTVIFIVLSTEHHGSSEHQTEVGEVSHS